MSQQHQPSQHTKVVSCQISVGGHPNARSAQVDVLKVMFAAHCSSQQIPAPLGFSAQVFTLNRLAFSHDIRTTFLK
jgi:hypothetical protein